MRVTPSELRRLRQGGIHIRFAQLESMAFVLSEIPQSGSGGTSVEEPCSKSHWGFVLAGEVTFETNGQQHTIPTGSAFHLAGDASPHRFRAAGAARVAGFEPVDPINSSDAAFAAQGFEVLGPDALGDAPVIPTAAAPLVDAKRIDARAWSMSSLVLTKAHFGPGSGYTTDWCDAPHWGLVTAGRLAIEWEHDIEVLAAGDVYHCPAGPAGHRFEAADPASILDLTPLDAFARGKRIAPWRRRPSELVRPPATGEPLAVAGIG
jgi:quercetin dioxygenase-like cupin family protein